MLHNLNQEEILSLEPNVQRTTALWSTLVENCLSKGKRGMRVFGDMTAFFKNGFTKELLDYESCLEQRFNFPAIGILLSLLSLLSYCCFCISIEK